MLFELEYNILMSLDDNFIFKIPSILTLKDKISVSYKQKVNSYDFEIENSELPDEHEIFSVTISTIKLEEYVREFIIKFINNTFTKDNISILKENYIFERPWLLDDKINRSEKIKKLS